MDVDLTTSGIAEYETSWQSWLHSRVVVESEPSERRLDLRQIAPVDRQIEIAVLPRLLSNERIDAPAAVDPDATALERVQDLDDARGRHASPRSNDWTSAGGAWQRQASVISSSSSSIPIKGSRTRTAGKPL